MSTRAFWIQWWVLIALTFITYIAGQVDRATFFLVLLVWTWMLRVQTLEEDRRG